MSSKTTGAATKEEARPALMPKLRFPEFRGADGWKGVPLSVLVSALDAGVSVNSGDRPATGNEIGILKTSAVSNGVFEPQENKVVFDEVERGRVKEPVKGDTIIISRMNTPALVGANAYIETSLENIYLPDRLWAAKSKSGTSMRFVASILGSDKGRAALSKLAIGSSGSMKNITKPDVLAFLIDAPPSPAEQQKIAECLSSVDELVAAQARKVDALKTHKKGLMQQFFPREGETQPRLCFPEFQNAGEWEVRTIGEMFGLINGCAFKPEDWKSTGTPIIRIQNLNDPAAEFNYSQAPVPERNRVESGDLLFAWSGTLGSSFGARIWNGPSGVLNQHIYKVLMDEQQITLQFALLVLARVEEDIARRTHGFKASFVHVKKADLVQVELLLPSVPEQQRIATCLISLDALIAAETQKYEALKTHKKGLMQQLFPSPEGVET